LIHNPVTNAKEQGNIDSNKNRAGSKTRLAAPQEGTGT
jgi:hypothetical protein